MKKSSGGTSVIVLQEKSNCKEGNCNNDRDMDSYDKKDREDDSDSGKYTHIATYRQFNQACN